MEDQLVIERLRETLQQVRQEAGEDFSGLGIIVCDMPEQLPLFPIRRPRALASDSEVIGRLAAISSLQSEFHDGFHVLTSDWKLIRIAQYFSPPIVENVDVDRTKRFGGRYLAALFGSVLPGVRLTGVASTGFGVAIFQRGVEIYFRAAK